MNEIENRQCENLPQLKTTAPTIKDIYLAGGCFWGTEHFFKQIEGVTETEVGFANGHTENPTYKEVYTDETGYAETVHVSYAPDVVSLEFLLRMFFKAIDPTSLNRQGHDEGTRYRTGIYYVDAADVPVINKVYDAEQQHYDLPLVVERQPLERFYTAEEYHQDYLDKNPAGYCHLPRSLFEFARKAKETKTTTVRKATKRDIQAIMQLLHQVDMVHHVIRPDLFKPNTTKYNERELEALLDDDGKPVFVYDDGQVRGHAFCVVTEVKDDKLLEDIKTLYIDDICVDDAARGKHVGTALYEYVRDYARSVGCNNITLNVWEGNNPAMSFYRNMGMKVQKTTMEIIL